MSTIQELQLSAQVIARLIPHLVLTMHAKDNNLRFHKCLTLQMALVPFPSVGNPNIVPQKNFFGINIYI